MQKKILFLTLLSAVAFFNPFLVLNGAVQKLFFYLFVMLSFLLFRDKDNFSDDFPGGAYAVVVFMTVFSIIPATIFRSQTLMQSVTSSLPVIFAFYYLYILRRSAITTADVIRVLELLCILSIPVYIANVVTFPNNIFVRELEEDLSRGILRVPVIFIEVFVLLLFYNINQILLEKNTKRAKWWVTICILMIVLSVTRQIIVVAFILAIFFYMKESSWFKKIAFCAVVCVVIFYVVPEIPMFKEMIEFSEEQADDNEEEDNIRIQAWEFYTVDYQANPATPVIGNGTPSMGISRWGKKFAIETDETGYMYVDVGWAGFFWLYGGIGVVALAIVFIRAIAKRKRPEDQYLTYWFLFIVITAFASGPIVYYYQIIIIVTALYLTYKSEDEEDSPDNTELQQLS